jgi:drug/metabolite transporter (DMT)-like permease
MPPFAFAGEIFALGTSLLFSIGATFFTLSSRQLGSAVVNRGRLLAATIALITGHLLIYGVLFPAATADQFLWLAASGIIGLTLGDAALFQAFVQIGPRLTMLVFSTAPIWAALVGWAWHGEVMSAQQLVGVAITLAGVLWVVSESQGGKVKIDRKLYLSGLFFAFLGALGQAGGLITAKEGLTGDLAILSGQVIRMSVATLGIWILALIGGQVRTTARAWRENPRAAGLMLLGTTFGPVLGVWCSLAAVRYTPEIGVASTLQSLPPIFLIPIGFFFLKEKVSFRAIAGTVMALAGVAILFIAPA